MPWGPRSFRRARVNEFTFRFQHDFSTLMNVTLNTALACAPAALQEFERRTVSAPYEEKGVLFSEVFFLHASVVHLKPPRIFESGRARGVSTYLLGVCFPTSEIISIEYDRASPDVAIAAANLRELKNVQCRFGDAQRLLPGEVKPGDVVVVDGPKHFRALRLAFRLLCQQQPAAVFIHDCYQGSCERTFLDKGVPGVFFSDDAEFVRRYRHLDEKCWALRNNLANDEFRVPYICQGRNSSYGPTFACIPYSPSLNYSVLSTRLFFAGLFHRLRKSLAKSLNPSPPAS